MTVTVQSVRDLLDVVPSKHVTDTVVQANIDRAKRVIDNVKDPLAVTAEVDDATRAFAVWLTYGSYSEGISQDLGNIPVALKEKMDHFRKVAEFFINRISREAVDLNVEDISEQTLIGLPPDISALTTSEGYIQES